MNANYVEICRIGNLEADFQQVPLVHFFLKYSQCCCINNLSPAKKNKKKMFSETKKSPPPPAKKKPKKKTNFTTEIA